MAKKKVIFIGIGVALFAVGVYCAVQSYRKHRASGDMRAQAERLRQMPNMAGAFYGVGAEGEKREQMFRELDAQRPELIAFYENMADVLVTTRNGYLLFCGVSLLVGFFFLADGLRMR